MLASNPRGVAVQLVKWYQCMAVHWQLNDRHHIQIFNVVPLDSYVISDLWSADFSSPSRTLQWATIFVYIISEASRFSEETIFVTKCALIFSRKFLWNIFIIRKGLELIKNIRKSLCQIAAFLDRFKLNLNFPDRYSKNTMHQLS